MATYVPLTLISLTKNAFVHIRLEVQQFQNQLLITSHFVTPSYIPVVSVYLPRGSWAPIHLNATAWNSFFLFSLPRNLTVIGSMPGSRPAPGRSASPGVSGALGWPQSAWTLGLCVTVGGSVKRAESPSGRRGGWNHTQTANSRVNPFGPYKTRDKMQLIYSYLLNLLIKMLTLSSLSTAQLCWSIRGHWTFHLMACIYTPYILWRLDRIIQSIHVH